jgi:5-methylcytosine-specific restriction protein A
MRFVRGNKAIRDHIQDGRRLFLFRDVEGGQLLCEGEFRYLGHHIEEGLDTDGHMRQSIVFELEPIGGGDHFVQQPKLKSPSALWKLGLLELESLARAVAQPSLPARERKAVSRQRAEAVKVFARRRAAGVCECCLQAAPFMDKQGRPFLEVHHLDRLSDGGADDPERVAAICPNCHRCVHQGVNGAALNDKLKRLRS